MPKAMYIIGTDHKYQNRSEKFTELQHEGFERYISQTVVERSIAILAEENNEQAITEAGLTESSIQKLARVHSIRHLFCELDRKSRAENGMEQESGIRITEWMKGTTEDEIEQKIQESYRNREAHWLRCILKEDVWPILFICGANHSVQFLELALKNEVSAVLLAEDWGN